MNRQDDGFFEPCGERIHHDAVTCMIRLEQSFDPLLYLLFRQIQISRYGMPVTDLRKHTGIAMMSIQIYYQA